MGLSTHIIRRLLLVIPMLLGVTLLTFTVSRIVPVDPLVVIVSEKALDKPDIVEAAVRKWGLDKPLPAQYLYYLRNLLHGDLGVSFKTKRPVAQDLAQYLPATVELALGSLLFALAVGLPLGILAAVRAGSWVDHLARLVSLLGASMPPFWSGLMALFIFYFKLQILPGPGRVDTRLLAPATITGLHLVDTLLMGDRAGFVDALRHLILPSLILGWFTLALICRITRSSLLEVLRMDYIRTARAKGLRERAVLLRHALRNAFIPTLTALGLAFAGLMTGAIMTETIFAWPGIGRYAVESAVNLDYPAVLGTTLLIAVIYIFVNLAVDVLYGVIDPRIREA
ncbi:MAG: ABC transporter permease [Chloroflexi bacterium]|nr:ABC transporter permease [Chloroflexota bacterium]